MLKELSVAIFLCFLIQLPGFSSAGNDRPIVGILAQEVSRFLLKNYPEKGYHSYIAASYVKFVEGAGARAVPVFINKSRSYYEELMSSLNGVLLPGGSTYFNQSYGYADAATHIYDIAKKLNDNGTYFPLWGTCLGFEALIYISNNNTECRRDCSSSSQSLPLEFVKGYDSSRMFKEAPTEVINILKNERVTPNFHIFCITVDDLATTGLNNSWKVLAVNHDRNGFEFVSAVEHVKYPFYGIQFHPEKNIYEFVENKNISHTINAVKSAQYFADFVVNESRKSSNKFPNSTIEENSLFYNYIPEYTGKKGSAFAQTYGFSNNNGSSKEDLSVKLTLLLTFLVAFLHE